METIRVNMTPCEDIKTIHASQNDNEAREWGFELHNNGEKIDSSSISDQLVFKSYEGGTEQILPENTSTPTTSPFKGDIKYPQGLLTDQEFLYRESPTEEDGLAKITDIKGNTLVWNQLVENGDFSTSSGWSGQFATVTISNNVASVRQDRAGDYVALRKPNLQGLTGHKYLVVADVKSAKKTAIAFYLSNAYSSAYDIQANTRTVVHAIITVSNANNGGFNVYTNRKVELAEGDVVEFYHVMLFDLTLMGLDISNPSEFTSLFPLSYYSYNQGSLLSFNGNGIKTVGKNLFSYTLQTIRSRNTIGTWTSENTYTLDDIVYTVNSDLSISLKGLTTATGVRSFNLQYFTFEDGKQYKINGINSNGDYRINVAGVSNYTRESIIDGDGESHDVRIQIRVGASYIDDTIYPMLRYSSVEDGTYEPYVESISSLPISTYFSNGMKSAGSVYDELMETKAITRIGVLDLDSVNWSLISSRATTGALSGVAKTVGVTKVPNMLSPKYEAVKAQATLQAGQYAFFNGGSNTWLLSFYYDGANKPTGLLYYELATPTETSFTTASLVTENAEIPLSNEDGILIGKCTEQLSSESGFFDAKIKLADEDGECYSNKIQLHIERSPQ